MTRKGVFSSVAAVALGALVIFLAAGPAHRADSGDIPAVRVLNFPPTQQVQGTVTITGPISHAVLVKREGVIVPPIRRSEITNLVQAGTIETDGYSGAVLSLQGEVKSATFEAGTVGAMLIPEEEPIAMAMRDGRRIEFPLEVTAKLDASGSTYFNSDQIKLDVAFPRYRVYFYNSGSKGVEANLYVYLTN